VRRVLPLVALVLCSLAAVCSQPKQLTILYTNDIHASFLPHEAGWVRSSPKPLVGGFGELWWMVDSIRHAKGTVLLLDGGDVMTGTPISEYDYKGSKGGALFEMMNLTGYDAWTIGNHDLDISQDNLREHTSIVRFPTVSANLTDSAGGFPFNNKRYVILEKNGLRIGIIGLMSKDLATLTNTNNLKGLKVASPVEVTQHLIDTLQPLTDLIMVLSHEGVEDDSTLAASTHGLNIIIGGHSHTRLTTPKYINHVIICQAGSNCENLGQLDIAVDKKSVADYSGKLITLWSRERKENEISKLVAEFGEKIDKEYGEVIGTLQADWKRGRGESALGQYVCDAMRESGSAQWGVTNSSGLRKDLAAGPVKKIDIFEILPFRNVLCTFTVKGKDLRAFVTRYAGEIADGRSSVQLTGIHATWKRNGDAVMLDTLLVAGKPVADGGEYTGATSDFVINQADKYLGFKPENVVYTANTMFNVVVDKVRRDKTIAATVQHDFPESH
jgi:2',3'-cyclic-nucleotide 2'-phosphodiesterase (5'-nucleotidase family)